MSAASGSSQPLRAETRRRRDLFCQLKAESACLISRRHWRLKLVNHTSVRNSQLAIEMLGQLSARHNLAEIAIQERKFQHHDNQSLQDVTPILDIVSKS